MTEAEINQFTSLSVDKLQPSPDNPRKHIDPAALEQLAANIKEHGVISPLVVRPIFPTTGGIPIPGAHPREYEIVSGERRWRASKMAGLASVPVRILQLSDAAALEIQVIENLQRADIHELEEADGYKALQERYGYSVDDLAAKVGKSVAYIYGRLKLCSLVDESAREAFFSRTIAPSVALFIARLAPKLQAEAAKLVLTGGWEDGHKAPYATRDALNQLRHQYSLKLADAPFSTESEELVPAAGPCTTCPKRSGNAPTLFATETPDVCTDPPCYVAKKKRHFAILVEDARAAGRTVIEGKKAKEIFPWDTASSVAQGYVLPTSCEYSVTGEQERPWNERLGKHMPVPTLVVHPKTREVVEVLTLAELKAAKKAAGINSAMPNEVGAPSRDPEKIAAEKKQREREEAKRKERLERSKDVAAEAISAICQAIADGDAEVTEDALSFVLASHPAGRLAMVDAGVLPAKARDEIFEYDRIVVRAAKGLGTRRLAALLVRASLFRDPSHDSNEVVGVYSHTGEYTAELRALAGLFPHAVSLKDLEKKATNARVRSAAVAAEGKKVDAALAASGPGALGKKLPKGPNTAMAAALANAKPGKAKTSKKSKR